MTDGINSIEAKDESTSVPQYYSTDGIRMNTISTYHHGVVIEEKNGKSRKFIMRH